MNPIALDPAVRAAAAASLRNPKPKGPALQKFDAASLMAMQFPDLDFVLEGLLTKGLTLIAGRPKVGKSWLTLQVALHVARGTPLFGEYAPRHAGRVTYLALEEPARRTQARLARFVTDPREPALQNLDFIYRIKPILAGGAAELDQHLAQNPSDLIVIDTLVACSQARGNRDAFRADYAEVNVLRELAEKHGAALLLVVHSRKAPSEYHVDGVSGTSGVTAAADAIWSLARKPEGAILECAGRDLEEMALALRFCSDDAYGWHKTGSGDAARTSEARQDILAALKDEGPMKPVEIARQTGKNAATVRRLLQEMVSAGQVFRNQEGKYVSP